MVFAILLRSVFGNGSDALEQAPWARGEPTGVTHHDYRVANISQAGFQASVGTVGDSYDNALAEMINGLYKAEVIHKDGPW